MQLFDPNNPNEKKKIIVAAVLFVVAMGVLGYVFFGGSSKPPQNTIATVRPPREGASPSNRPTPEATPDDSSYERPLPEGLPPVLAVADASRNIFAFYEPTPKPTPEMRIPTPTPTPTPPMTISQLNPPTVFARTTDFTLEVTGEKFTPAVRVTIDGRELSTRFISAQQLFKIGRAHV